MPRRVGQQPKRRYQILEEPHQILGEAYLDILGYSKNSMRKEINANPK